MEHVFWGAALLPPLKEVCVLGALLCPVRLKYLDQLGFVILAVSEFVLGLMRKCDYIPAHLVLSI